MLQVRSLTDTNARLGAELTALQQQQGLAQQLDGAAVTAQVITLLHCSVSHGRSLADKLSILAGP